MISLLLNFQDNNIVFLLSHKFYILSSKKKKKSEKINFFDFYKHLEIRLVTIHYATRGI